MHGMHLQSPIRRESSSVSTSAPSLDQAKLVWCLLCLMAGPGLIISVGLSDLPGWQLLLVRTTDDLTLITWKGIFVALLFAWLSRTWTLPCCAC